jgi:hypothetical protein
MAVVVEVQLTRDPSRRYVWLEYVTSVRSRFKCPVYLVVVTRSAAMARWCAKPLRINPMGSVLRPLVVTSASVPEITKVRAARERPELALLSAIAHGTWRVAYPVIRSLRYLDEERRSLYLDLVETHLKVADRPAFEALMIDLANYKYQGSFARRHFNKGKAEGEAKGEAKAILTFLNARGIPLTRAGRSRILTCTDLSQLDKWLQRVPLVASEKELFHEPVFPAKAPRAR